MLDSASGFLRAAQRSAPLDSLTCTVAPSPGAIRQTGIGSQPHPWRGEWSRTASTSWRFTGTLYRSRCGPRFCQLVQFSHMS